MASIEDNTNEAEAKQAPPPPSPPGDQGGDGEDRISGLCDDVLVRILELALIDARELVRTGVLSRRWRGLWTRVPSLHFFTSPRLEQYSTAGDVIRQYVASVNNVLAQRARSEASIEVLQAYLTYRDVDHCPRCQLQQIAAPAVEAAEAWIRYTMRHHVRCFFFSLQLPEARKYLSDTDFDHEYDRWIESKGKTNDDDEEETDEDQSDGDYDEEEDKPVIDLEELPSSTKLETMWLELMHARVQLPSTAVVFASLKNLTLSLVDLAPGTGHLLARLLSSACCPSLQRLYIRNVFFRRAGTRELMIDAGKLLQLIMFDMNGMRSLELRTPNLLGLDISWCSELRSLTVSAPALEELVFHRNRMPVDAIHGDFPRACCADIYDDIGSASSS